MRRLVVALVALHFAVTAATAQDDADLIRALQKTTAKVIREHEISVACILVSRSEFHPRDAKHPGKLGVYEPDKLLIDPAWTNDDIKQIRKKLDLADPTNVPPSFGSGVVIDAQGLILTNYHVVQDAAKIYVRLPGGKASYADVHAADPRCDLAVLKLLNANVLPLKAIRLGDSDKLERGQFVLTLSNPFAIGFRDGQPSASYGILSNIRRRAPLEIKEEERQKPFHFYSTLLQTDARLSLGCSGGALLNLKGEMVGLLTSMAAIQGGETPGGFALPINAAMRAIIETLKRGEEIDYGFLGVSFTPRGSNGQPGVVLTISRGSPAAVDGRLLDGDILLAVNDQLILESDDVYTAIGMQQSGTKVKIRYLRGGRDTVVDVTLAKLWVPGKRIVSSLGSRPYFRGLRVDHASLLVQMEVRRMQMENIPQAVLVSDVLAKTSADNAGVRSGDVISHVNQIAVATPAAFYAAVNDARGPVELTLLRRPPARVLLK